MPSTTTMLHPDGSPDLSAIIARSSDRTPYAVVDLKFGSFTLTVFPGGDDEADELAAALTELAGQMTSVSLQLRAERLEREEATATV